MKRQRNYFLDENVLRFLDEMCSDFDSDPNIVIENAIRLYYKAYKCPPGTVWNMDDISCTM